MAHTPWMPNSQSGKLELMARWKTGLSNVNYRNEFRWDPADCDAVIAAIIAATAACAAYEADNSSKNRLVKDNRMDEAVRLMREFAGPNIRENKRVPPEVRLEFGIPPRDEHNTPGDAPDTRPVITELLALGGGGVEIRYRDEASQESWAIPDKYKGGMVDYALGPEKVTDYEALPHTEVFTTHIGRLNLSPNAAGQWLSICIRWLNHTGKTGRPSEIMHLSLN